MELSLRDWRMEDQDIIKEHLNNRNVSITMPNGIPYPYTDQDAYEGIQFLVSSNKIDTIIKAIVLDEVAVGSVSLFVKQDIYRKTAEMGIWIGEPYWNKGIGTWAIHKLTDRAFHYLDIVRIYAKTMESNIGAQKMLLKCGYTKEAVMRKQCYKLGKYQDFYMYSILKDEIGKLER